MLNGPQPIRGNLGASVIGSRSLPIERENPDQLAPPALVQAHLNPDERTTSALSRDKPIVVR
jgi:hypothetical protein